MARLTMAHMRITHLGHACLLIELADERILIDPGNFSEDFTTTRDLSAILITHQHPDHLDPARFLDLVRGNPQAQIFTDPMSVRVCADLGVEVATYSGPVQLGEVTVTPFGELHAIIHDELPRITNVGVALSAPGEPRFYHPGDALDAEPGAVDILAFPLNAPWQRSRDMAGFLRRINPPTAVPIHDGLLQRRGRDLYLGHAEKFGGPDTRVRDLAGAGAVVLS